MPADVVFWVGRAYGMTADRGVDTYTAIWLCTAAGGRLMREDDSVGILAPGAFADIVAFRGDLLDGPVDDLPSRQPALTVAGGRPVHDPDGLFGAA
jgi:predicted amidohydrolase YtcJ